MIKIAICDDDPEQCFSIEEVVKVYGARNSLNLKIDNFSSGEDLYAELKCGEHMDIIFLDIELKKIDGIEVGRKIREELKNNIIQIIYISSFKKYAQQLFITRPMQFLIKPIKTNKIEEVLSQAIYLIEYQEQFTYQVNKSHYKVHPRDIYYFRSLQNRIEMVCIDQSIIFYGSLESVYQKLKCNHFFYCNRSFLVNFGHIECFHPREIVLSNGERLPQGNYRKKELQVYKDLFIGSQTHIN